MRVRLSTFRIVGLALIVLSLLLACAVWLGARPLAEYAATQALGREVRIGGDVGLDLFPAPGLTASEIYVKAAPRSRHRHLLTVGKLSVRLAPRPLLGGDVVVDELDLSSPVLYVPRELPAGGIKGGKANGGASPLSGLPTLRHLHVEQGRVVYSGQAGAPPFSLRLAQLDWRYPEGGPGRIAAEGSLDGKAWRLTGRVAPGAERTTQVRLDGGAVQARVAGRLGWPVFAGPTALELRAQGPNLAQLLPGAGRPVLRQAFGLDGRFEASRGGQVLALQDMHLHLGGNALRTTLSLDRSGARRFLSGDLTLTAIDAQLPDLAALARRSGSAADTNFALPAWLRQTDARVALRTAPAALEAANTDAALRALRATLVLDHGQLALAPFHLRLAEGHGAASGALHLDLGAGPAQGSLALKLDGLVPAPWLGPDPPRLLRGARFDGKLSLQVANGRLSQAEAALRYRTPRNTDLSLRLQQTAPGGPYALHAEGRLRGQKLVATVPEARFGAGATGGTDAIALQDVGLRLGRSRLQFSAGVQELRAPYRIRLDARAPLLVWQDFASLLPRDGKGGPSLPEDLDASVELRAARVILPERLTLRELRLDAGLASGRLTLRRLALATGSGRAGGRISGQASLAGLGKGALRGEVEASIEHLRLAGLLRPFGLADNFPGILDGKLSLALGGLPSGSRSSNLRYRDRARGSDIGVRLLQTPDRMHIAMNGNYRSEGFRLNGSAVDPGPSGRPWPFQLDFMALATSGALRGTLAQPWRLDGLEAHLRLAGPNPRRVEPVLGFRVPELPPYRLHGHLSRHGPRWALGDIGGRVGKSDLAGRIDVRTGALEPEVSARLHSQRLDIRDLAGVIGAESGRAGATVLPDAPFELGRLGAMDARLHYTAATVKTDKLPVDSLAIDFSIHDKVLRLAPLRLGLAGGSLRLAMRLGPGPAGTAAVGRFVADVDGVRLGPMLRGLDTGTAGSGRIDGHGSVSTSGASVAAMLASMHGRADLNMAGGTLDALLVEMGGIDLGEALPLWLGKDRRFPIRCAHIRARAHDGLVDTAGSVLDTSDTRFTMGGAVRFDSERLGLVIHAHPKDLSLLAARAPFIIEGSFRNPDFHPSWPGLAGRAAVAAVLAAIAPPAALLALVEPGLGEDAPCGATR